MSEVVEEKEIELSKQYKLFADYYVGEANLNGTKAAILAGYSAKSARSKASQLLTIINISAYIEKRLDEIAMTSKEILAGFTFEAKGSIADVLEKDGTFDFEKMVERGADKLLKKLKIKKTVRREKGSDDEIEEITHEFEMYDAQSAKVHIGKAHGIFTDNVKHSGEVNFGKAPDLSKLTGEELDIYETLLEKTNAA